MRKDTEDPKKIRGAVLLTTTSRSIPDLNHKGISTIPPLTATEPPKSPARKPLNILFLSFYSVIFYSS